MKRALKILGAMLAADDVYCAMDTEAKPLGKPQLVASSVGGGICQSDVTH